MTSNPSLHSSAPPSSYRARSAVLSRLSVLPSFCVDFYSLPHQGLRWALSRLMELTGRTDFGQEAERLLVKQEIERACDLFEHHLEHEELVLHPALAKVAPALCHVLDEEHAEHRQVMGDLVDLAGRTVVRPASGRQLYLSVSRFTLENLAHMELEETAVQRALEEHYESPDLMELHDALITGIAPEVMADFLKVILPSISEPQRQLLLAGPRRALPPLVFQELLSETSIHLSPLERDRLIAWGES